MSCSPRAKSRFDVVLAAATAGFSIVAQIRRDHPSIDVILDGSVERVVATAGALCDAGPAHGRPYDHQFLLDRIKRLRAARERNN